MKLKHLMIRRKEAYEQKAGELIGSIKFSDNKENEVQVALDDEQCRKMLMIVSPGLVTAAEATAEFLRSEAAALQLEAPEQLDDGLPF